MPRPSSRLTVLPTFIGVEVSHLIHPSKMHLLANRFMRQMELHDYVNEVVEGKADQTLQYCWRSFVGGFAR